MIDIWKGTGIWEGWRIITADNETFLVDPSGKRYVPSDIIGSEFVGQKEIREILGWSKQQVSNYHKNGRLPEPDQIVAGRPLWKRNRIEEYKESRIK